MQPQICLLNNITKDKIERLQIMITEEITNKMETLFPNLTNANSEGNTFANSGELWKGVADKSTDTISGILAPIKNFILDVQPDLQVRNPDALPVVQVEVISTMGGALVDNEAWDKSAIENKYVDVKLHRISRPFMLTGYDLMRGERVESKVAAAMKEVAQGVVAQQLKRLPAMQKTWDSILGSGRYPGEGNGNPLQCSCLKNSMDRGARQATVHEFPKNRAQLND